MKTKYLTITFSLLAFMANAQVPSVKSKWPEFETKYGPTLELWNETTQTPHRAVLDGVNISNGAEVTKANVEQLALTFLQENENLLGVPIDALMKSSLAEANHKFYLNFVQQYRGVAILNSEIVFRVHKNGNLSVFGFDLYKNVNGPAAFPSVSLSGIENGLKAQFPTGDESEAIIEMGSTPYYFPVQTADGFELRPVLYGTATHLPHFKERFYYDVLNGNFYQRENTLCQAFSGNVDGSILPVLPTDVPAVKVFPNLYVTPLLGSASITDSAGNFTGTFPSGSQVLIAELKGPFVNVKRFGGNDAQIVKTLSGTQPVPIHFNDSNSTLSERNVFYHTNIAHDYVKFVDTGFTLIDQSIPCTVEDNRATCNAYWTGTEVFYNTGTGGCINAAHSASTIYHEYGHALNDILYQQAGKPQGLQNLALHEAMADVTSCMMLDENRFALGFYGVGLFTRNLQNTKVFPQDVVNQQHTDGLMLGGAFWDLRLATSPEVAYRLAHFAKYGTPDDPDLKFAFAEYFLETLIADDDDGNLGNGSPHFSEILTAFCKHGIGLNLYLVNEIQHTEIVGQPIDTAGTLIQASLNVPLSFANTIRDFEVRYSTDNFIGLQSEPMLPVLNGFEATIPAQPAGTVVRYFFVFRDTTCQRQGLVPSSNFPQINYAYWVGDYQPVFMDDFETDKGWTVQSTANSGLWERATPTLVIDDAGKTAQPGNGHSPNGSVCFVTGAQRGSFWYSNDVDNGSTTLTSPVFSAKAANYTVFQFYKWFAHGAGTFLPASGSYRLQLTNDGTSWVDAEFLQESTHREWKKVLFKISSLKTPTDSMQVRIIVDDPAPGTIVEALIDDFEVLELNQSINLEEIDKLQVGVFPNPASDQVSFEFAKPVSGVLSIFTASGKKVWERNFEGETSILWGAGRAAETSASAGIYFYSLRVGTRLTSGKLLLIP